MRGCSPGPLGALFLFMRLVPTWTLLCLSSCLQARQQGSFPKRGPQSTRHKALPEDVSLEKLLPETYKLHPFWENPRGINSSEALISPAVREWGVLPS